MARNQGGARSVPDWPPLLALGYYKAAAPGLQLGEGMEISDGRFQTLGTGWSLGRLTTSWHWSYFQSMDNDFMKRGYLLPEGCKDLIDVLKKRKKAWQHPDLFVDLQKLQKVFAFEFKPSKPIFWKPLA